MLEIVPYAWYSWRFRVFLPDEEITQIEPSWFGERGRFELDSVAYMARRDSVIRGSFVLEKDGHVLARAERTGLLLRSFWVMAGDRRLSLKPVGPLARRFVLLHGDRIVGSVRPKGFFTRAITSDLPEEILLPVRVLIVFLVLVQRRRRARAAAGG